MKAHIGLLLLAGGAGLRFGSSTPKQFLPLNGIPLAIHSLQTLSSLKDISEIVVVCLEQYQPIFKNFHVRFALPGKERQDSVISGINTFSDYIDHVCIHDAARPFINQDDISEVFQKGYEIGAATLAEPVFNTLKKINPIENTIINTIDRTDVVKTHTPQFLKLSILKEGLRIAKEKNIPVTDDVACAELLGLPAAIIITKSHNIKITKPQDLTLAEALAQA